MVLPLQELPIYIMLSHVHVAVLGQATVTSILVMEEEDDDAREKELL